MMDYFLDLFRHGSLELASAIAIGATGFAFLTLTRLLGRNREEEIKKLRDSMKTREFSESVISALRRNALTKTEDLILVYKGVFDLNADDNTYHRELTRLLRQLAADNLLESNRFSPLRGFEEANEIEFTPEEVAALHQQLSKMISELETEHPFSSLPTAQRTLLIDADALMSTDNIDAAKSKLRELSSILTAREDLISKIESLNRWSVPLAISSSILTIVFGLFAIF